MSAPVSSRTFCSRPNRPSLGRGASGLPYLSVLGRNTRRVHDHSAFAIVERVEGQHARGRLCHATKRADEVDLDDPVEGFHRKVSGRAGRLVATRRLDRIAGAGAVHEDALLAIDRPRRREACVDAGVVGNVDAAERHPELRREPQARLFVEIEDGNLGAVRP